jgi:5-formyltetrahydrofolate cyclo-ligase
MDKKEFREECKKLLNKKNRYIYHKKIENQLFKELSKKQYKNILIYISMGNEVNTKQLINRLKQKNKQIFVPFMEYLSFKMVKFSLPLKKKKFNIYEPKNKNKTKQKIDVAVVPIIGIDKNYKRVGFGKGMYDRFFDNLNYNPTIIFTQIYPCITLESVTDKYDIVADFLITYNLVCKNRRNNVNRSVSRFKFICNRRFFDSKKN